MLAFSNVARVLAVLALPAYGSPLEQAVAGSPSVTIANGVIVGTTTKMSTATAAVSKYVGIPYAASPPLRFGPPKAAASWTKPLMATTTKPACIQQFNYPQAMRDREMALFNNPGLAPPQESEDCMYVNVYVPPGTTKTSKKAVMFWVFGGNLQFGTGGLEFYDGTSFAYNQDVILVTHNYRTNVFGFPNAPELTAPNQNPGFLDQRFALQWVHDNIEAFGGDPDKVTIFGESAGGYSVKQLVAQPPSPLNFRAAIMESEAALNEGVGFGNISGSFQALAAALGCDTAASQLKCLRSKSATQIKSTIEHDSLGFFPVSDGKTQTTDVRPAFKDGTAAKVPFMIGTNENEGNAFAYLLGFESDPTMSLGSELQALLPGYTALQKTLETLLAGNTAYEAVSQVLTLEAFQCPARALADLAHDQGYSVHRYLYNATFPNLALFPDSGVWHSSEIPEVFGTYPRQNSLGKSTAREATLSQYMQTAWANFAKNPAAGPQEGWPELGVSGPNGKLQNLGGHGISGGKTIKASSIDQRCALFAAVIDAEGL